MRLISQALCLAGLALAWPANGQGFAPSAATLGHDIITAENLRLPHAAALEQGTESAEPALRALAIEALGRIGDLSSLPEALALLGDPVASVRLQAAVATGLIALGGSQANAADSVSQLRAAYDKESSPRVRGEIAMAIGRLAADGELSWFADALNASQGALQARVAQGLGIALGKTTPKTPMPAELTRLLGKLAAEPGAPAIAAAYALSAYKGPFELDLGHDLVSAFSTAKVADAKAYLARTLAHVKTDPARDALLLAARTDQHIGVRVEALRALGKFPLTPEVLATLSASLNARSSQVQVQALQTISGFGPADPTLTASLAQIFANSTSIWVKETALETLSGVAAATALPLVEMALARSWPGCRAGLSVAPHFETAAMLQLVLAHLNSSKLSEAAAAATAAGSFSDPLLDNSVRAPFLAALSRPDAGLTSAVADTAAKRKWQEFAAPLAGTYTAFTRPDDVEVKVEIVTVLGTLGVSNNQVVNSVLAKALADDDRSVALAAADAIKALTGKDVSAQVPPASIVHAKTASLRDLRAAAKARVKLITRHGTIILAMSGEAPLTAYNFVSLAKSGFYDGLTFHRVIPHFVAQGGDPRGDGSGGPGYLIRDEVGTLSHVRGTVGIATAGKDTGGSQFFINHGANLHLDGSYTVFARVIAGMRVVDELEVDDQILKATVEFSRE